MKTTHALIALLATAAAIWGCNKDETTSGPASPGTANEPVFQALFADNIAEATQNFTMNASTGGQVVGEQGTRLEFEPGAFLHMDGTAVTGQVDVAIVEVMGIGDMIWLNKQTVGNDNGTLRLLRSGGAINITATQGGNTLRVAPGGLSVRIPTDVGDPAMELFSGSENEDGSMIWERVDTSSVTVVTDYVDLTYFFTADSLMWMNCDYFAYYPSTTQVAATIPAGQSTDSTMVWIAFPTENAVMHMYYSGTGQTYLAAQIAPVGMEAVIVGLRRTLNGDYSSFTPITISDNMTVPMTFAPTTMEEFQDALNAL